jgi:hypothetical protein
MDCASARGERRESGGAVAESKRDGAASIQVIEPRR